MRHQYHPLGFEGSRLAQGFWRMEEWNMTSQESLGFIEACLDLGVTTFDHADIYGDYQCETLFGNALKHKPALRDKMEIITKCGILLPSNSRPDINVHRYNYRAEHILASVDRSLANLQCEYIDTLLLHRPSPLMNADEVAQAFDLLFTLGKVKHFGVSNFTTNQFDLLQSRLDAPLIINQVELSPLALQHFEDGTLDHVQQHAVTPMAWSPFAGGDIFSGTDEKAKRVQIVLKTVAEEMDCAVDQVVVAWLLRHPSDICPVMGSGKIARLAAAVDAMTITLSDDDWFRIWVASQGRSVA
ncbi:aldo/keto reductase [Marinomonas primoryensis]|jgi:predicted oxidoreductase|uniref:Oxidoreductase n=1 Tax=Marinomonas primoryensis TaxID=178399 RepID=A0A859CVI8_9GAMM|nr:aldo/keto reductase [Marinomonas primoryensis]QKK80506.1 oxidoreductase [Marinomonas primoryensis]